MADYTSFKGTGVALITPFKKNLEVDFDSLGKIIDHCVQGGVENIISMGTTGESVTLSQTEKNEVLQFTIEKVGGRAQVIVGIGGNDTAAVCSEMESLDTKGISAILSSSPAYNKPSQEGIYQHYMQLGKISPLPIIIYNVPGRTCSNITAETCLRLAHSSEVFAGVKEASGDLVQANKIIKDRPAHFLVLSGDDPLALALMGIGGDGVISVIANAFPFEFSEMIRASIHMDFSKARMYNDILLDLHKWLYIEGNPVGIKACCHILQLCENVLRLPLVPMSESNFHFLEKEVRKILQTNSN